MIGNETGKLTGTKLNKVRNYFRENLINYYDTHPEWDLEDPEQTAEAFKVAGADQGMDFPIDSVWELFVENLSLGFVDVKAPVGLTSINADMIGNKVLINIIDEALEDALEVLKNRKYVQVQCFLPDWEEMKEPVSAWVEEGSLYFLRTPFFPYAEAVKVLSAINKHLDGPACVYLPDEDKFIINQYWPEFRQSNIADVEVVYGTDRNINGQAVHGYYMGEGWAWYNFEDVKKESA